MNLEEKRNFDIKNLSLFDKITTIKGIGKKKEKSLEEKGIDSIFELLNYFPRKYENKTSLMKFSDLKQNENAFIKGQVISKDFRNFSYKKKGILKLKVISVDENVGKKDILDIIFFNPSYINKEIKKGETYIFYGKVQENFGNLLLVHPEIIILGSKDDIRGILPLYTEFDNIKSKAFRNYVKEALECIPEELTFFNDDIIKQRHLVSPKYAYSNIHFPSSRDGYKKAKYYLIYQEFFFFQLALMYLKTRDISLKSDISVDISHAQNFIENLLFSLTEDQKTVWKEISEDLKAKKPMNRLLQGDVGSGKTVIAEIALYCLCKSGFQGVIMSPTEILAKQHYNLFLKDFSNLGLNIGFLSSSMKKKEKEKVLEELKTGKIDILSGTHAVIQDFVEFHNLGLVITDEQHRFGVNQRNKLSFKGKNPNALVMTATPIPRTLAVTIYGDLDISSIKTKPHGRKKIETISKTNEDKDKLYEFVKSEIDRGRQCYMVAPLIEESEVMDLASAKEIYNKVSKVFEKNKVSLIYGSMKEEEKDSIMKDFASGNIDILVSTVVIEVGINVPNATIMIIENAERFGLAQLHQLRGRVGRGSEKSYCFLISDSQKDISKKRLETMVKSNDGFFIAEEDLKLRGPGEFLGNKQHGIFKLKIGDVIKHKSILEEAWEDAKALLEEDKNLELLQNQNIKGFLQMILGEDLTISL